VTCSACGRSTQPSRPPGRRRRRSGTRARRPTRPARCRRRTDGLRSWREPPMPRVSAGAA
jgi:hypothetical protein